MSAAQLPSPIAVLREATRQYRALRFAWAVLGLAAAVAVVRGFGLSGPATVYAIVVLLALMSVVVVFEAFAEGKSTRFTQLSNVIAWTTTLGFATVVILLISSTFFDYPKPLPHLVSLTVPNIKPDYPPAHLSEMVSPPCGADSVKSVRFGDCIPSDILRFDLRHATLGRAAGGWYLAMNASIAPLNETGLIIDEVSIVVNAIALKDGRLLAARISAAESVALSTNQHAINMRQPLTGWELLGRTTAEVPRLTTHRLSLYVTIRATNRSDGRRVWLGLDVHQPTPQPCGHECVAVGTLSVTAGSAVRRKCDVYLNGMRWDTTCLISET